MLDTQSSTDKPSLPAERRLRKRHRLSAIAYLDIGPGNGGIILDLCEEGIGLQAVAPLDMQQDLDLKIKAPGSRTKIEAKARIVWLSQTNRQAGVHLLDLPSASQLEIQNWIRSLASPQVPSEEPKEQRPVVASPPGAPEPAQGVRRPQWVSLMPEFDSPHPATGAGFTYSPRKRSEEATESAANLSEVIPTVTGTPENSEKSDTDSGKFAQIATALPANPPALQPDQEAHESNGRNATASPNAGSDISANVSEWRRRFLPPLSQAPALRKWLFHKVKRPLLEASKPSLPPVETEVNAAAGLLTAAPGDASTTSGTDTRNRVLIPILLALCSIVFFSMGTWVGHLISGRRIAQTAAPQIIQPPAISPAINQPNAHDPAVAPAPRDKGRSLQTPKRPVSENRKALPSPQPVNVPSANQTAPPPLAEANLAAPPSTTQPVAIPVDDPAPPDPNALPTGSRMVAGRELKPADRFNPSHLSYRVEPTYPPQALQQGVEGIVKLQLEIGVDGDVRTVKLLSGPPLLAPAATDAARYWRYLPALLNGKPVESEQEAAIEFRLPH